MPSSISGHRGLFLLLVLVALPVPLPRCAGESVTCLAVYREGGAPAVF
uniref:p2C76 n=1 Tax=Arundo donax TaxID=35708 RepID=A0A0A9B7D1_ARUDO